MQIRNITLQARAKAVCAVSWCLTAVKERYTVLSAGRLRRGCIGPARGLYPSQCGGKKHSIYHSGGRVAVRAGGVDMLITVGSVTTAVRLARIFEKNICPHAEVVHTPQAVRRGGCSYSVRVPEGYRDAAEELMRTYNVPVRKFYSETMHEGKREYHDIS